MSLPTPKPHKLASRWLARLMTPAAAVMAVLVGGLRAQLAPADASPKVFPTPSLQSMGQALRSQDYTVEQLRRFRRPGGAVVTVRERLQVDANGTKDPLFELTFLGVEGEPAGSPLSLEWQQTYARYGSLFVRNGSFHVRDLPRAISNYTLHDFGPVVRAGRSARRMVVFPNTVDKAIWVLDLDAVTSVPLFVAEFDNQLKLFAEIEVTQFATGIQAFAASTPTQAVTQHADFQAANAFLGGPTGLIDPAITSVVADYSIDTVEVYQDPINGREKLVMSYTDGIDQFMVVQTVNVPNPFAGLPGSAANTIGRFRDPAVSALVFWEDGVSFHVAGRGSLTRLDDVARTIFRQALTN
ncbi:MAG: hypothetical protein VYD05_00845 [Planctomycetota bacterium]|nr:hypothetical protein [Planctomycetota bacterium]